MASSDAGAATCAQAAHSLCSSVAGVGHVGGWPGGPAPGVVAAADHPILKRVQGGQDAAGVSVASAALADGARHACVCEYAHSHCFFYGTALLPGLWSAVLDNSPQITSLCLLAKHPLPNRLQVLAGFALHYLCGTDSIATRFALQHLLVLHLRGGVAGLLAVCATPLLFVVWRRLLPAALRQRLLDSRAAPPLAAALLVLLLREALQRVLGGDTADQLLRASHHQPGWLLSGMSLLHGFFIYVAVPEPSPEQQQEQQRRRQQQRRGKAGLGADGSSAQRDFQMGFGAVGVPPGCSVEAIASVLRASDYYAVRAGQGHIRVGLFFRG